MTHVWRIEGPRTAGVLGVALALLVAVAPASDAADEVESPSKWQVDVLPYAWIPGTYGSLDVKDNTVDVDATPSTALHLVFDGNAFAAAGYFALAYDRFSAFSDTFGGYAEVRVNERIPTQLCNCTLSLRAKDETKFVIGDVGFGYRLGVWTLGKLRRPFTLGVYAGARYMYLSSKLTATAGVIGGAERAANVFESVAWADPLIGVRWSLPVLDWASFDFRGDIGGFGASSELVWGLVGTARIWLPWKPFSTEPYLAVGYRVVAFDRTKSDVSVDLQFRGPTVGAGFVF